MANLYSSSFIINIKKFSFKIGFFIFQKIKEVLENIDQSSLQGGDRILLKLTFP